MAFVVLSTRSLRCSCSVWKRKRARTNTYLLQEKLYGRRFLGCGGSLHHQLSKYSVEPDRGGRKSSYSSELWQALPCSCCESNYVFDYDEHVSVELKQLQVVSSGTHCLLILSRTASDTIGERYDQLAKDYEASQDASLDYKGDKNFFTKSNTAGSSFAKTSRSPRVVPVFMSLNESTELIQTIHRQSGHSVIGNHWYGYGSNALLNFARLLYFLRRALQVFGLVENMARISQPKNTLKPILALFRRILNHAKYPTFQACFYDWMVNDVGFEVEQVVLHGVNSSNMISDIRKGEDISVSHTSSYSNSLNRDKQQKKTRSSNIYASCRLPVTRSDEWIRARLCLSKDGKQFFVNLPPWDALGLSFLASLETPIYVHASLWIRASTSKGYIPCHDTRIAVSFNDKENDAHRSSSSSSSSMDETMMKSKLEEKRWNFPPPNPFARDTLPFRAQRHSIPFHSPEIHQIIPFRRPADKKPTRFIPFTEDIRHSLREMLIQGQFVEAQQLIAQLPSLQWELEILDAIRKEDFLTASRLQSKLKMVVQLEKILLREKEQPSSEYKKDSENNTETDDPYKDEKDSEEEKP